MWDGDVGVQGSGLQGGVDMWKIELEDTKNKLDEMRRNWRIQTGNLRKVRRRLASFKGTSFNGKNKTGSRLLFFQRAPKLLTLYDLLTGRLEVAGLFEGDNFFYWKLDRA